MSDELLGFAVAILAAFSAFLGYWLRGWLESRQRQEDIDIVATLTSTL